MKTAPIALFTYNRPDHTARTIAALAANDLAAESDLILFSDAPRNEKAVEGVCLVREIIANVTGFRSVTVIAREENFGLSRSIISGVTDLVKRYGRVIVLEDDLVTSPYFLRYMNDALERYADDDRVISVHGYVYPVSGPLPETFFLRGADCWGWGTWKRGWELFETDGAKLLGELRKRNLTSEFDFDDSYHYTRMLERQVRGENDSWAIRWYASAFLKDRLTLYPGRSLVQNIGNDASGSHCSSTSLFDAELAGKQVRCETVPVEENRHAREAFRGYFEMLRNSHKKHRQKRIGSIFSEFGKGLRKAITFKSGNRHGFSGSYASWADAREASSGYDSAAILEKVKVSLLKVKRGEAVYERDSVLFDTVQYSWPLLAGLLWIASQRNNTLNVLDFGGSLGSSYFQNRGMLAPLSNLRWNVVEQEEFVRCGKANFEDEQLKFYYSIDECLRETSPDVVVMSSVLSYVENPHDLLQDILRRQFPFVVVDRTPLIDRPADILKVQTVPAEIYAASYPAWFFGRDRLLSDFSDYEMIAEFDDFLGRVKIDGNKVDFKGFIFRLKG